MKSQISYLPFAELSGVNQLIDTMIISRMNAADSDLKVLSAWASDIESAYHKVTSVATAVESKAKSIVTKATSSNSSVIGKVAHDVVHGATDAKDVATAIVTAATSVNSAMDNKAHSMATAEHSFATKAGSKIASGVMAVANKVTSEAKSAKAAVGYVTKGVSDLSSSTGNSSAQAWAKPGNGVVTRLRDKETRGQLTIGDLLAMRAELLG